MPNHLIIGGGVFGLTAAIALRERGYSVTVLDAGPVGNPVAASHDLNKVVRAEYGADGLYREMVDGAIDGWHDWNTLLGKRPPASPTHLPSRLTRPHRGCEGRSAS